MSETYPKGLSKPYDSAFKSIIQKCPRLALFLINELFFKNGLIQSEYTGSERVKLLNRELTDLEFGNLEEDIRLVVEKDEQGIFHMECESTAGDTRVMLRMVRYDTRSAVEDALITDNCIHVRIDDSGVLFLRSTKNTPSMVKVILECPQGNKVSYKIPTLKLQDYTLKEMLDKKLFILLPFLFFNYEKQLGNASDPHDYEEIKNLFETIIQYLQELADNETITGYEASTLYDALKVVIEALGEKHKTDKEVQTIMGGKVLEFSADKYYNAGKKEGLKEGREAGKDEERVFNIRNAMDKLSMTAEAAMDFIEIPVEEHEKYALLLKENAPLDSYVQS